MENWTPCPRCGSNRVQKMSKWALSIAFLSSAGCLIWVAFLIPPLWIAVLILILLGIITPLGKSFWQCKDCNYTWDVKENKAP